MVLRNNYFYKVYIDDMDNIIHIDDNKELSIFIGKLRNMVPGEPNYKYVSAPNTYFYIGSQINRSRGKWYIGWMPMQNEFDGYEYYKDKGYKYGGDYISIKRLRRLKLKEIDNVI